MLGDKIKAALNQSTDDKIKDMQDLIRNNERQIVKMMNMWNDINQ